MTIETLETVYNDVLSLITHNRDFLKIAIYTRRAATVPTSVVYHVSFDLLLSRTVILCYYYEPSRLSRLSAAPVYVNVIINGFRRINYYVHITYT